MCLVLLFLEPVQILTARTNVSSKTGSLGSLSTLSSCPEDFCGLSSEIPFVGRRNFKIRVRESIKQSRGQATREKLHSQGYSLHRLSRELPGGQSEDALSRVATQKTRCHCTFMVSVPSRCPGGGGEARVPSLLSCMVLGRFGRSSFQDDCDLGLLLQRCGLPRPAPSHRSV